MSPPSTLPHDLPALKEQDQPEEPVPDISPSSSSAGQEPIYSDPLDVLEIDAQIYDTLDSQHEESSSGSEESETVFERIQTDHESSDDEELDLNLSAKSLTDLSGQLTLSLDKENKSSSQEDLAEVGPGRKLTSVRKTSKRLSAVLGKYVNGITESGESSSPAKSAIMETSWQLDSSSWEFLSSSKKAETPKVARKCAPSPYDNMFVSERTSRPATRPQTPAVCPVPPSPRPTECDQNKMADDTEVKPDLATLDGMEKGIAHIS